MSRSEAERIAATIERLRANAKHDQRKPPARIGELLERAYKDVSKSARKQAAVARAWVKEVPEPFQSRVRLIGLERGFLTVEVSNDSERFELDRELRMGLLDRLVRASTAPLRRVKIVVASPSPPAPRHAPPQAAW